MCLLCVKELLVTYYATDAKVNAHKYKGVKQT